MKQALIFLFVSFTILNAQTITDSLHIAQPPDSLSQASDSLKQKIKPVSTARPFSLKAIRFDTLGQITQKADTIYKFKDIIFYNYSGFADLFRNHSSWQIFDFLDNGLPRYVSALNLLPQQTPFVFNGAPMNDPLSGLYNTRFLVPDDLDEVTTFEQATGNPAIRANSRTIIPDSAWSRIMFREGDLGFTTLNLGFARKLNNRLAVQLGGTNTLYDLNGYQGVIYQGTVHFQITPEIYSKTRVYINTDKVISKNESLFPHHIYKERYDALVQDIYWSTDKKSEVWHFRSALESSWRKRQLPDNSATFRYKYDRYLFSAERNWQLDSLSLRAKVRTEQSKVWGSVFYQKYTDSELLSTLQADHNLNKYLGFHCGVSLSYRYGREPLWSPEISALLKYKRLKTNLYFRQQSRYPYRNERSFNAFSYSGNKDLANERFTTLGVSSEILAFDELHLSVESAWRQIKNEIRFNNRTFYNGPLRDFIYGSARFSYDFYKFRAAAGGQINFADVHLAPSKSIWIQARYHDTWFNGALVTDAIGNLYFYDTHNTIEFNPVAERFYWLDDKTEANVLFSYKLVATIKSAQLYFAMDNPFARKYAFVNGYFEYYRRARFGLNWVLWN